MAVSPTSWELFVHDSHGLAAAALQLWKFVVTETWDLRPQISSLVQNNFIIKYYIPCSVAIQQSWLAPGPGHETAERWSSQEMYHVSDQPSAFFLNPVRKWSSSALIQNSSQCPSVCPWKSIDSLKTDVSLHSIRWPFKINLGSALLRNNLFKLNKLTVSL